MFSLMMFSLSLSRRSLLLLASISLAAGAWNTGTGGGNNGGWNAGNGGNGGGNGGNGGNGGSWSPGTGTPPATVAPPQNTNQPIPSVVPGDGCAFAGQFLPVPGDQCTYYVCVVGGPSDPWADGSNRYTLARQRVPCAPGSGVPAGYTGGNSNPCEARPGACVPPKPTAGPGGSTPGPTNGGSWSWATQGPSWQAPPKQYVVKVAPPRAARSPSGPQYSQQELLQAWGNMQSSMKQLFSQLGKKK